MNSRYYNFDLLRVICTLCVIILHVSALWIHANNDSSVLGGYFFSEIAYVFNGISRFAVPCFFMLSGGLAFANSKNRDTLYYYTKKKNIIITTIIFSLLYALYVFLKRFCKGYDFNIVVCGTIWELFSGSIFYHLWFLYVIIGIYILTPFLFEFKNKVSSKCYAYVIWMGMAFSSIAYYSSSHMLMWDIGYIVLFIPYYVLGNSIFDNWQQKQCTSNYKALINIVICVLLLVILSVYSCRYMSSYYTDIVNPLSPIIIFISYVIMKNFNCLRVKEIMVISYLSKYSLYIFLFHAGVLDFCRLLLLKYYPVIYAHDFLGISALFVICFLISLVCAILYEKLYLFFSLRICIKK